MTTHRPLLSWPPAFDHLFAACRPMSIANPSSALPEALLQAYQQTDYRVQGHSWSLRIGQPQPGLRHHYLRHAVHSACYLTACNPLGQAQPAALNLLRMQQLRQALQRAGWSWLEGQGVDPLGLWEAEDSLLIWGMDLSTAQAWGERWQQNAILHCGADLRPQLVLLR